MFSFVLGFFLLQNKENILVSYDNAEVPLSEDILDVLETAPDKYNISLLQIPEGAREYFVTPYSPIPILPYYL